MSLHSHFGKKSFDKLFEKIIDRFVNSYLKRVTDIDYNYNFEVKSRYGDRDSDLQDWIIEIYTDKPIPSKFQYSDEYKKKKNVDGFHQNVLAYEIKQMLPSMGIDIKSFRNTVGIKFMNSEKI